MKKLTSIWVLHACVLIFLSFVTLVLTSCGSASTSGNRNSDIIPAFWMYWSVETGDLNGDGSTDIAVSMSHVVGSPPHPGSVAVYFQDPAHAGAFSTPITYDVGNDPVAIAVGDVNGDGKLDIVTANTIMNTNGTGTSGVSVLLQNPTRAGSFLTANNYAVGKNVGCVAIGDLNGDARPDLALGDAGGLLIMFQDAVKAGKFLPPTRLAMGLPSDVAIGDLNGDHLNDIAATIDQQGVTVLL